MIEIFGITLQMNMQKRTFIDSICSQTKSREVVRDSVS